MKIKFTLILIICALTTACMSGRSWEHVDSLGNTYKVTEINSTHATDQGVAYQHILFCKNSNLKRCKTQSELHLNNPSLAQQLGGAAATVGGAYLVGEGLKKSGDNNEFNSNSRSFSYSRSRSNSSASAFNGGNSHGRW